MAGVLKIADAADLLDRSFNKIMLKEVPVKTYYDKMYNVRKGITDLYTKESGLSEYAEAARTIENGTIIADVPVQTFDQTYEQVFYDIMGGFSKKMWKFGIKKNDLTRVAQGLKKAIHRHRERLLAHKYDAAYLSSYTESDRRGNYTVTVTGGDGSPMATASHTREDGGTAWTNVNSDGTTTNMNLDYPGLKGMARIGGLMVDPRGNPMPMEYNRIVVKLGSNAAFRAKEIKRALKEGKIPGEFSHDGAAVGDFELVENPYLLGTGDATSTTNLSSATNWHAIATEELSDTCGPQYLESEGISVEGPNIVFKTDEIQFKAGSGFTYGHNDARCTAHAQGDNS